MVCCNNALVCCNNDKNLKKQVKKMLRITPDSFVFVYSSEGIFTVPVLSINGSNNQALLYGKQLIPFFQEFFTCFIGDKKLRAFD